MVDVLPDKSIKHSAGDIMSYGEGRAGMNVGGRWLWEKLHSDLLSEDVIRSKSPERWFRDMCVTCGVSTTMLEQLTSRSQSLWTRIQNERGKHHNTLQDHIHEALAIVLSHPIAVPHNRGAGHVLPAGSLFGLPTVVTRTPEGEDRTMVQPEAITRILQGLFREHYTCMNDETMVLRLRRLNHISKAYMAGAISVEELLSANIAKKSFLAIRDNYGGTTATNSYFNNGVSLSPVIAWLETLNNKHWHIPREKFLEYIEALQRLPVGKSKTAVICGMAKDEAFAFAKVHHNGTIGGFLQIYREARGHTSEDYGVAAGHSRNSSREIVSQHERGITSHKNVFARALSEGWGGGGAEKILSVDIKLMARLKICGSCRRMETVISALTW